jgi:hypothetical protein
MSMPPPAIAQAISAPNGPVAAPNRPGSEKVPAPTIEPTTMAVRVKRENFCSADAVPFPDKGNVCSVDDAIASSLATNGYARRPRRAMLHVPHSRLLAGAF